MISVCSIFVLLFLGKDFLISVQLCCLAFGVWEVLEDISNVLWRDGYLVLYCRDWDFYAAYGERVFVYFFVEW